MNPFLLEEEEQSLKLALGQPWACSVSDFIFLASAYESQCAIRVLIIVELARRGTDRIETSNQISVQAEIWTPNLSIGSPLDHCAPPLLLQKSKKTRPKDINGNPEIQIL